VTREYRGIQVLPEIRVFRVIQEVKVIPDLKVTLVLVFKVIPDLKVTLVLLVIQGQVLQATLE
jgi:hypothetical protein